MHRKNNDTARCTGSDPTQPLHSGPATVAGEASGGGGGGEAGDEKRLGVGDGREVEGERVSDREGSAWGWGRLY